MNSSARYLIELKSALFIAVPLALLSACFEDASSPSGWESDGGTQGEDSGANDASSGITGSAETGATSSSSESCSMGSGGATVGSTGASGCDAQLDDCPAGEFCIDGECEPGPPPNMVLVPAGVFPMGCHDPDCDDDERPVHDVTLSAFAMDKLEVTVGAYSLCADAGVCDEPEVSEPECNWGRPGYDSYAVNCLSWTQARMYCEWAGKRLPTEAEWEKAARGTDGRRFPWGDDPATCSLAVIIENGWGCGTGETWPVGSKPAGASPYGSLDMVGNVHEWTADWHDSGYYAVSPTNDPLGPSQGDQRVLRGASFFSGNQSSLRAGNRSAEDPAGFSIAWGFRCADG